ncbi:biphenyl-2,3-diol 1,2-dioxygenase [Sphingobium wenxiniae]|uniref:Biphenyl-2,3-diol 1,2-dioxygenase n=1 Tax=Sphingobium wenxiniae (strain DSM 21828 / CGMCC 1.7748 / JZ-1) TaxID=595605 RepID=A0A562K3U1_SPHWJ|nr:VOC family protein [Sphingobium wenxiniae]MBB6193366.1 biphenyl-2,3-diol 1,2-dioxygenase [Sphingobium wenxiniae]TWH90092.1 biphenyl-2,3-diol 1,2-dioxygenase [Sphingobium wenxiniae]
MCIRALSYIGLEAEDLDAWQSFATDVLGLMKVPSDDAGTIRFRLDSRAWRIAVDKGDSNDLTYIGFEVAGREELDAMRKRIEACGVTTNPGSMELRRQRGVLDLFHFEDPIGLRIELFYGATEVFEQPFCSPAGVSGFMTAEQGLGHVVLLVPDVAKSLDFYERALGLRLTDVIDMTTPGGIVELLFMNCNPRHHTIALAGMASPRKLDHFMIQVASIDDMGLAYDRALKAGTRIRASIGRHSNDHMVSFYAFTPSGAAVEYGWGAREIDHNWNVVRYDTTSVWGHHSPIET